MPAQRNEEWSAEEIEQLRQRIADGRKMRDIARDHQRSKVAISAKAYQLGIVIHR